MIHSRALDRDTLPGTFDEWKAASRTEVARAKEKYNAGLLGPQKCSNQQNQYQSRDHHAHPQNPAPSNSQHVPMDIDTTTTQMNFRRLTPEECTQLAKEGWCFCCCLQGHMSRECPKNTKPPTARVAETPKNTTPPLASPPPAKEKLTCAQKIRALKAEMEEDECTQYMDDCDMGKDFWSAGA